MVLLHFIKDVGCHVLFLSLRDISTPSVTLFNKLLKYPGCCQARTVQHFRLRGPLQGRITRQFHPSWIFYRTWSGEKLIGFILARHTWCKGLVLFISDCRINWRDISAVLCLAEQVKRVKLDICCDKLQMLLNLGVCFTAKVRTFFYILAFLSRSNFFVKKLWFYSRYLNLSCEVNKIQV